MGFNLQTVPEKAVALAFAVGARESDDKKTPAAFMEWLRSFRVAVGLPKGLKALEVKVNDRLLDVAFADVCHPSGPRPVTRDDIRRLYEAAM